MQTLSHSLRNKFVRDMSLPISVVQDPYWQHQIDYLDAQYGTHEKIKILERSLGEFSDENAFLSNMSAVRQHIIDHIQSKEAYKVYNDVMAPKVDIPYPQKNIYHPDYCFPTTEYKGEMSRDYRLVSIDLKKANFQTFRCFNPEVVDNCRTYEDFAKQFTDSEYFLASKQIRQTIFGKLNPKRQQRWQKVIMNDLLTILDSWSKMGRAEVISVSSDEIILRTELTVDVIRSFFDECDYDIKVEDFVVSALTGLKSQQASVVYIKTFFDMSFTLKCCPSNYVMETLRHLNRETPCELDRVFYSDGRLCQYQEPLFKGDV